MIAAITKATLTLLKAGFLLLLYLFLFRAVRAVYLEISPKRNLPQGPAPEPAPQPARRAKVPKAPPPPKRRAISQLVFLAPPTLAGQVVALEGGEVVLGRGPACQVHVDDTFASTTHARVAVRDGRVTVEDLGSTNGTFLNDKKLTAPAALKKGDRITIGQTVLEARG